MLFVVYAINYNLLENRIHYYNTTRYTISKYKDLIAFSSGMKLLNSDETPFGIPSYQWVHKKNVESTFSRNSTGMRFYIPNMFKNTERQWKTSYHIINEYQAYPCIHYTLYIWWTDYILRKILSYGFHFNKGFKIK